MYGDPIFNGHILSDTTQAIGLMGNTGAQIWSSNDRDHQF